MIKSTQRLIQNLSNKKSSRQKFLPWSENQMEELNEKLSGVQVNPEGYYVF